jgi:hypothetical protein
MNVSTPTPRHLLLLRQMQHGRHPVGCPASEAHLGRFGIVVRLNRLLRERNAILQAPRVDYRTNPGRGFADRTDVNAASAAQQIIRSARAETISLHQGPIRRSDIGLSRRIRYCNRRMRPAERACTGSNQIVGRWSRQSDTQPKIATVAATIMVHCRPPRPHPAAPATGPDRTASKAAEIQYSLAVPRLPLPARSVRLRRSTRPVRHGPRIRPG